jgi:signal peptidase I
MPNKPKKWIAALLGLVSPPVGMLYTAHAKLALAYFSLAIVLGVLSILSSAWKAAAHYIPLLLAVVGASHAYLLATKYPDEKARPSYSRWYGVLGAVICIVALAVVTRAFFFEPFRAPSSSMLPTIPARASLVVQKWGYGNYGAYGLTLLHKPISSPLARGDLIVFELPSDRSVSYVKRLVGLPGDKVAYRGKQLFINGDAVPLRPNGDYFDPDSLIYTPRFVESLSGNEYTVLIGKKSGAITTGTPQFPFSERCTYDKEEVSCEVPAGHLFTVGDNRDNSNDSRMWGFVPTDNVVGKVVFIGS